MGAVMRLVKVSAMNLQPGMFVAELDRPWLETPFSLQGFVVRDTSEVLYISDYVDHVFVDAEYRASRRFVNLDAAPSVPRTSRTIAAAEPSQTMRRWRCRAVKRRTSARSSARRTWSRSNCREFSCTTSGELSPNS